jgi:hypothetical protein
MRSIIIAAVGAFALFSTRAFTQQPSQGGASIPNFSGIWAHPSFPSFEAPASGPGPLVNRARITSGPRHLQLQFTVEDEGVFKMPWSATVTYRPGFNCLGAAEWPEMVCAENAREYATVPRGDKLDF